MIVWRGWGIFTVVAWILAMILVWLVSAVVPFPPRFASLIFFGASSVIGAALLFAVVRGIEGPGRYFRPSTASERNYDAGTFFCVPTRYWVPLLPLVGIGLGVLEMTGAPAG